MPTMMVTLGFGRANLTSVLATYACFKVTKPFNRITAVTSGQYRGRSVTQVGQHDHCGQLISSNVEHAPGTIILLQTKMMAGVEIMCEGGLFLRLRAGAPLYNVIAAVPTGNGNLCGDSFMMFSGNADIMNTEALAQAGLDVSRGYVSRYMDMEELSECFRIVRVSGETAPRPLVEEVATPMGVVRREMASAPARRLILRGKKV